MVQGQKIVLRDQLILKDQYTADQQIVTLVAEPHLLQEVTQESRQAAQIIAEVVEAADLHLTSEAADLHLTSEAADHQEAVLLVAHQEVAVLHQAEVVEEEAAVEVANPLS